VASSNYVGTPAPRPSFLTYAQAGERLDWQDGPRDGGRNVVLNPTAMAALVDAQKGLFAPAGRIGEPVRDGHSGAHDRLQLRDGSVHPGVTAGARATTYTTHGTTPLASNGATAIAVITGTGAMVVGDQFTIAGVNEVNPDTKQSTGSAQGVHGRAAYAGGAGNVTVSQPIYTSGPYQNVSATIPTTTALVFIGTLSTAYPQPGVPQERCRPRDG
jgi:hypothetical protein